MLASIGSTVGILPDVLADLAGPLGDRVRRGLDVRHHRLARNELTGDSKHMVLDIALPSRPRSHVTWWYVGPASSLNFAWTGV